MRLLLLLLGGFVTAQSAPPSGTVLTVTNSQVTVRGLAEPATVRAGTGVRIAFDITPARGVRVYAPGAEYQAIAIELDVQPGLKAHDVVYPPSEMYLFEPLQEMVPVYQKPFRLVQSIGVAASAVKGKEVLALTGRLAYQACNDRVCFKPAAIPFRFDLKVKK